MRLNILPVLFSFRPSQNSFKHIHRIKICIVFGCFIQSENWKSTCSLYSTKIHHTDIIHSSDNHVKISCVKFSFISTQQQYLFTRARTHRKIPTVISYFFHFTLFYTLSVRLRPNTHKKNTVLLTSNADGSDILLLYRHLIQSLCPGYGVFL